MAQASHQPAVDSLGDRVLQSLSSAGGAAEAIEAVLREAASSLGAPVAMLWLLDDATGLLRWGGDWASGTELEDFRAICRRLTFTEEVGLPGAVLAAQDAVALEIRPEAKFPRAEPALAAGLQWAVGAPLATREGMLGVIELLGRDAAAPPGAIAALRVAADPLAAYLARLRIEDRLRATEEHSETIVRAALDCIITMDHEGRVLDFNPAAEQTFGHARDEVVGRLLAELIIPEELRDAHHEGLRRYLETGEGPILNRRLELEALRADGTRFPVELTVTRVGSGDPPRFAGFIRDIAERRRAELEHERLLRDAVSSRALAEAAQERSTAAHAVAESARTSAEIAGMRLALLAQAGERMLSTREYERTMQQVVELAVPAVADWCSVTVGEPRGILRTVAVAHADPRKEPLATELVTRYPPRTDAPVGPAAVVRSGRTELIDRVRPAMLEAVAQDARHLELLRELDPRAALTVPLRTPQRVIGALTLVMAESGRTFDEGDVALAESLASRAGLAIENARLFTERSHIAETLQRSLLPTRLPSVPGLDVAVRYRAAGEHNLVGGDFYDFFRSGDGVWTAILGDVTGKGPEAAALTALTRHTLRAGALRDSSPMANLRLLNEALLNSRDDLSTRFATVVYTRICRNDGGALVTVSTGGHLPPLILRAGGDLEYLPLRGTLLGAVEDVSLSELDVQLREGDLMLLYTDGVTELRPDEPQFGDRLLERVLRAHVDAPAAEVVDAVEHAALDAQSGEPRDDIALVAVRARRGAPD